MKKFLLTVLVLLLLGGIGITVYLNTYFLPVQLKEIVLDKSRQYLGRDVTFGNISFHPLKGVTISDIKIHDPEGSQTFLSIQEIRFNVLLPAVFKERAVVIPSVLIRGPAVTLVKSAPRTWNFQDLIKNRPPDSGGGKLPDILVGKIRIDKAQVRIVDLPAREKILFPDVNVLVQLSIKKEVSFSLGISNPQDNQTLEAQGKLIPASKDFSVKALITRIDINRYARLLDVSLPEQIARARLASAEVSATKEGADLQVQGNIDADLKARINETRIIEGRFRAAGIKVRKDGSGWKGSLTTLNARDLHIQWLTTDFTSPALNAGETKLTFENNILRAKTSLRGGPSTVEIASGKSVLKGEPEFKDVAVNVEHGRVRVNGAFVLNKAVFGFGDRVRLSGHVFLPDLKLMRQGTLFQAQSSVDLTAPQGTLAGTVPVSAEEFLANGADLSFDGTVLKFSSGLKTRGLLLDVNGKKFSGDPQGNVELTFEREKTQPLDYRATVFLENARVDGLPRVNSAQNIKGKISIATDMARTDALKMTIDRYPAVLKGSVQDFGRPAANLTLQAQGLEAAALLGFFPQQFKEEGLSVQGRADVGIAINGALASLTPQNIGFNALLADASVVSPKIPKILDGKVTDLNGMLRWQNGTLTWEDLQARVKDRSLVFNGNFSPSPAPAFSSEITGDQVDVFFSAKMNGPDIRFSSLNGRIYDSSFDLKGDVRPTAKGALLNIRGSLTADLNDLSRLVPQFRARTQDLHPLGEIQTSLSFKGDTSRFLDGEYDIRAASRELTLKGYQAENVKLTLKRSGSAAGLAEISGQMYDGPFLLAANFSPSRGQRPFELAGNVSGLDLGKMRRAGNWKKIDLYGKFAADLNLAGNLDDQKRIKGTGHFEITEGHLWSINFLENIGKLLFIPEFANSVYTEASADLTIADRKVATGNLLMEGQLADLHGKGWIDFDKNIQFNIIPAFKQTEIFQSESFKKGPTAFLSQAEGYINIKISGTLSKPRYSVETLPTKVLQKATGAIWGGVQGILDELIQ